MDNRRQQRNNQRGDQRSDRRNDRNNRNDRDRNDRRSNAQRQDRPKKEAILNMQNYYNEKIVVKFIGGRSITGVLKGHDQLMNLVLEDVVETLRDSDDESVLTSETRELGTVIVRGPQMLTLLPLDGSQMIDNPFAVEQA